MILLVPFAVAVAIFATVARDLFRRARLQVKKKELERQMRERDQAVQLLPGGGPDHPIDIETPAVVESMAEVEHCLHCGGDLAVDEHTAETRGQDRLRIAHVRCIRCGTKREIYFRLQVRCLN